MEEFDAAWGEVEKGLRDSFRAGRERKRGQRLENTASNAQRQMEMIRQRQSQAPKAAAPSRRTAPRRTVSSPPTSTSSRPAPPRGGPKNKTVSSPPTDEEMYGRPDGYVGPNVNVNMKDLDRNQMKEGEGFGGVLSRGRQPPKEKPFDLGPVPTPANVPQKTPERYLGDRLPETPIDATPFKPSMEELNTQIQSQGGVSDWGELEGTRQGLEAVNWNNAQNQLPPLDEAQAALSGGETPAPVPQTGSATSQQPMQQIDPIDDAIEGVEQTADKADGVDDPSNDEQEATQAGWNAVNPPAPEPAPPAPIATPASQVPAISTPVNDGFNEALNQQFSEANRDVRNLTDEFGAEPGEPEPPAPVADTPVEVETEQPTSVADTPVEAPKPNPTEGLPKADPKAGKTAANIKPSKDVAQAATKNIASEGVSYGDYSKHIQGAMQGNESSLDFLRNNPDAVNQFSPSGLPKRIQDSIGGEAPAKKAPAKAKSKPTKPKSKKTTAKTVASGEQPKNPKKKSEPVKTDAKYGTFRGEKPGIKKSLSLSDLGFLRPVAGDIDFLTDREGRPSIAQAINPSHLSMAFARPENLSLDDLLAIQDTPLSFDGYRLMNNKGMPVMLKPPGPTGNDRFLHYNTGLSRMKANAAKHPLNSWNVGGKAYKDDGDFKAFLAETGLKSKNRNPFGTVKLPKPQLGRPIVYYDSTPTQGFGAPMHDGGLKMGYEMNMNGNKGLHQIHVHDPYKLAPSERERKAKPMSAFSPMKSVFGDMGETFGVKNVEMSIKELASRIKSATAKDSPGGHLVNVNDTGMDKGMLRELMQSLLTQPDQDETATISAGNTNKEGGYSVPLGVQLRGSDALDGESERNLLTYLQAPYGIQQYNKQVSALPNLPPNMLE